MMVKRNSAFWSLCVLASVYVGVVTPANAYVDLAPTLAKIVSDSKQVAVVEVVNYDEQSHSVVLKAIRALKGDPISGTLRHGVSSGDGGPVPRQILQWAAPGAAGVMFASRATSLVCMGESWYSVRGSGTGAAASWKLGAERPDLPLSYCGTVSRLADAVALMLAGKDAIITNVPHGAEGEAASFDLALNRFNIPGMVKLQRLRTNLNMQGPVMATSTNTSFVLGMGPVDEADVPELVQKLSSSDPVVRAEAAEDLRTLGKKAAPAAPALAKLLNDPASRVRFSVASALVKINGSGESKDAGPLNVLRQGLASPDAAIRRDAAKATGLAGRAAGALSDDLAKLLTDKDSAVQVAVLQAISILGPAAVKTVAAVKPLLDRPDLMIDAADALGRIGPGARPIPPQLTKMVSSPQTAVQWAGVRAMSQIGGPEARPAVEYMIKALPNATEVDGYNMMIFLSLLGPDAKDAEQTVRSVRIKNPVLPSATLWAMAPESSLPWQGGGRGGFGGRGGPGGGPGGFGRDRGGFGGPGGPGGGGFGGPGGRDGGGRGGPGGGPGGGLDISAVIYEAYVDELGERLHPVAPLLARKIMDGTAGNVPDWGYKLLAAGPKEAIEVLTPFLSNADRNQRERATVALGSMGAAAAPAKTKLSEALANASDDREKHLIEWSLRQLSAE